MSPTISGLELSQWRAKALEDLLKLGLSPKEVDRFLQGVTDLDSLSLRLQSFRERPTIALYYPWTEILDRWQQRIERRCPLQYLLESVVWRDFTLKVSPSVLIPRPETEYLIDLVLEAVDKGESGHWVDLGTGSGAIAIGLAKALTKARIHAVDASEEALAIALENITQTGFSSRITLYSGFWWTPLVSLQGQISGMVSNPPYIPTAELAYLQPEVINHEPYLALDGGEDGLTAIRYLIETAPTYLQSGGIWLIEMMAGQGETVAQLLQQQEAYQNIQIIPDLAGFDRYALAYRI